MLTEDFFVTYCTFPPLSTKLFSVTCKVFRISFLGAKVSDFPTARNMKDSLRIFVHHSLVRILWCVLSLTTENRWHQQETRVSGYSHNMPGHFCLADAIRVPGLERVQTTCRDMPAMWSTSTRHYSKRNTAQGSRPAAACTTVPDCCTGCLFNSPQLNDFTFWWPLKSWTHLVYVWD